MASSDMHVRSHVSRDLLQAAAMFKNERLVVWEYVANGLQYVDAGTAPIVKVRLDSNNRKLSIADNGRGMDWSGLQNFFVMHGENVDRLKGKGGRGRFGTGKSAAFGIANVLRITTVSSGKRSIVELRRSDLDDANDGDPVPVRKLERETPVDLPNGTLIEIDEVQLKRLDQASTVKYIERHLARWPKGAVVAVNNHECEYLEPAVDSVDVIEAPKELESLAGVKLTLKKSKSPLDEDLRGISIFSNGVWHETTLLTASGKEMSEFIFGEVDVPRLEDDDSMPPAFDASRSMKLNPDNPLVQDIYAFVGPAIEEARKQLVEAHRVAKQSEEAKRLREEASKIEDIINQDFAAFRKHLQKVRTATTGAGFDVSNDSSSTGGADEDDDFLFGGDEPATVVSETGEIGRTPEGSGGGSKTGPPRRLNPVVVPDENGSSRGHYESGGTSTRRNRGGFNIQFDNLGEGSARAEYVSEKRTIYVNLEHPQIVAALRGRGTEDSVFKRLAYEVAFSEYALALAVELENRGEYIDPSDPIVDIRETINRVARQAAPLYA